MGIFGGALRAIGYEAYSIKKGPVRVVDASQPDFIGGGSDGGDQYRSEQLSVARSSFLYGASSSMFTAVNKIVTAIGMAGVQNLRLFAPGHPWHRGDPLEDHELYALFETPNKFLTTQEFFEAIAGWRELAGNAYIFIHCAPGTEIPLSLWPLRPDRVSPIIDKVDGLVGYNYTVNNKPFPLASQDVMQIRTFNPSSDYEGLAPAQASRRSVDSDMAMQLYNEAFFKNGGELGYIFEAERETVDPKQLDLMEKQFVQRNTGSPEKMHKPYWLWSGFKLATGAANRRDASYMDGHKAAREDVFTVHGVHSSTVSPNDTNRATADAAEVSFARWSVMPRLTGIASQINKDLTWRYSVPCQAEFVGVIPDDDKTRADIAVASATALEKLMTSLGYKAGLQEAKAKGLISKDLDEKLVEEAMEAEAAVVETGVVKPTAEESEAATEEKPEEEVGSEEAEAMAKAAFGHDMAAWYLRRSRSLMARESVTV